MQFLCPQNPCRQNIVFVCARTCANAIQTNASQTKIFHSLQYKVSQNKSSKFKKMEEQATFLTLSPGQVKGWFDSICCALLIM